MHSDHLRKYPECLILELLSKESYCQNIQLITATCVRKLWFFLRFCLVAVNYCFGSVCAFYTILPYFYVQNKGITYLFMGYESLNLLWFVLEQYLLMLIINVWNNLFCSSKYILQKYYCIGIWKKKYWRILVDIHALKRGLGHPLA